MIAFDTDVLTEILLGNARLIERASKVRVSTHDLRIAAICIDHAATLVSRNRRDFDQVPGLSVQYWA